ncbi:MAG: SRPBCC family protein [Myxococcota bacterium]
MGSDNWMPLSELHDPGLGLGWYTVYEHWPIDVDSHRFILSMYFVPPRNGFERLSQEHTVNTQWSSCCRTTARARRSSRRSRATRGIATSWNDQEVLVRHLHHCVVEDVEATGASGRRRE